MNCKQGDLAYVFKSKIDNYGMVVTCLKLLPAGSDRWGKSMGVLWEIDGFISGATITSKRILHTSFLDSHLHPLRGDLTNDETEQNQPIKEIA
jgi:hypothetical protein